MEAGETSAGKTGVSSGFHSPKEKNDSFFDEWVKKQYSDPEQRKDYMKKHYIPDVNFAFTNFDKFFTERKNLLFAALKKELM